MLNVQKMQLSSQYFSVSLILEEYSGINRLLFSIKFYELEPQHLQMGFSSYLCQSELLEIELFDHLNVCKQMTDV